MAGGKVVVVAIDHSSQAEHAFKCEYHTILIIHSGGSKIFLKVGGGANSQSGCPYLLFCKFLAENCKK